MTVVTPAQPRTLSHTHTHMVKRTQGTPKPLLVAARAVGSGQDYCNAELN